ncbi:Forkhead box protein A2, partial [Frankliniella fusca]
MIDLAPRLCDVGPKGPKGRSLVCGQVAKRKLYAEAGAGAGAPTCKRRRTGAGAGAGTGSPLAVPTPVSGPGARFVDLQIVGEDGALVEEATIEEIWAPHATRLEIVVVDEAWDSTTTDSTPTSLDGEAAYIDLDDPVLRPLGPLGGTSTLHSAILREARQQPPAQAPAACYAPRPHADQADSDFGNLDWLINFKVDSVFEPKKQLKSKQGGALTPVTTTALGVLDQVCDPLPTAASPGALSPGTPVGASARAGSATASTATSRSASPKARAAAAVSPAPAPAAPAPAAAPTVPALTINPSPHPQPHRYSGPGKPPFTYTELIELALKDKGKLT